MSSKFSEEGDTQAIIESAFRQWAPNATFTLDPITPGHSGSSLFRADVRQGDSAQLLSGQYILKFSRFSRWEDAKPEFDAHELAYARSDNFSAAHIPRLVKYYASDPDYRAGTGYAMLYEIAGGSLDRYAPTDNRQDGRFQICASKILCSLLDYWADSDVSEHKTASELLTELCGYRLASKTAPDLHQFVAERIQNLHFVLGDYVLINPLKFFDLAQKNSFGRSAILRGLTHGDLHGGNILLNSMRPLDWPFYIIDFAFAHQGAVGYDAAYLELAHILTAIGDQDPVLLVSALYAAEDGDDRTPVAGDAHWARDVIAQLRARLEEWRVRKHQYRKDQIDRQLSLCRVAAGINWANKPVKDSLRWSALCYAGWAARQYMRIHEPSIWSSLGTPLAGRSRESSQNNDDLWSEIWASTKGFDGAQARFILIAESLKGDSLKALGQLPWSAVIDLDPKSDESGLHYQASPILSARRGIHNFSSVIPTVDPRRGTGWMMAGGWSAKTEYFPDHYEWGWQRLPIVREFLRRIAESTSPEPIHAIILPGATLDPNMPAARIGSIITAIGEATRGRANIHLLGGRPVVEKPPQLSVIPLETYEFVRRISELFGTGFSARLAEIPGPDRKGRAIRLDVLRAMEETLHVLHSSILEDQSEPVGAVSDFWRGRLPTWAELHAGLDIEREIHSELIRTLVEKLEAHRNQTVILEHSPGAGGTTAALRAAWDLRSRYPVAILHKYSIAVADRVRELFQIAEQPILLVAEASELNESAREELYRYLSRNNCRVVLLYLRRTLAEVNTEAIRVAAPMSKREAAEFFRAYKDLAVDSDRKNQLNQITNIDKFDKYRLPFYYGLVTFEREFLGIDRFVESHLAHVGKSVRDMLEHIALVTVFSNSGLPLHLLKAITGIDPRAALTLEDIAGSDPARLLVERRDGVRFMHWTIADKVLAHFRGGIDNEWRLDLKAYATDFIRLSVTAAGAEAMRALFRQIFIDRVGSPDEDDRENFAPIIENLDAIDITLGHAVLEVLAELCPEEPHFWAHLGRHQVYRLRRDYDKAEGYLRQAISLSPHDPLHHHTFGLVLRSQLRHRLKILDRDADIEVVFAQVNPLFEQAASEFEETRRLSPDNVYGYITHIQMITMAAKNLKKAAGADTIARVGLGVSDIDSWLSENLASAEYLLREATYLYATLERSDEYLTWCEADIDALYGDLDAVVELWEVANASGFGGGRRRRALANAYLARRERRWSELDEAELRRVVELMEQNLREPGRRDDDYELWFNAYAHLPDFDVDEAITQLALWSRKFPSWRAHYYTYVLHFLLWFERRTEDLNAFEAALDECVKRHVGRKSYSPVWYGVSAGNSGLVSESELGRWKKELGFFSNIQALRRVNGMIDVINGPQAGSIKIGGRVKAFFVPGKVFSAHRNENNPVHFFLGFSPSGLRAWSVEPGRDGAERPRDQMVPGGSQAVHVIEPAIAAPTKRARVTGLRKERGQNFIRDLLAAKAQVGATLSITELEHHLDALMGMAGSAVALGINVPDLVSESAIEKAEVKLIDRRDYDYARPDNRRFGHVVIYDPKKNFGFIRGDDGGKYWFSRDLVLPGDRTALSGAGTVVRFVPSSNISGKVARGIGVLRSGVFTPDGLIDDAESAVAIAKFVLSTVSDRPEGVLFAELLKIVRKNFFGTGGLEKRLGVKTVSAFLGDIDGLNVSGRGAGMIVRPARWDLFGPPSRHSTPHGSRRKTVSTVPETAIQTREHKENPASRIQVAAEMAQRSVSTEPTLAELKAVLIEMIRECDKRGSQLTLASAGENLNKMYPGLGKIHARMGFVSLVHLCTKLRGFEIGPAPTCYLRLAPPSIDKNSMS